jgi:hypothetical protein
MANAWAITHDSSVYSDPDKFNPDRYIPISEAGAGSHCLLAILASDAGKSVHFEFRDPRLDLWDVL